MRQLQSEKVDNIAKAATKAFGLLDNSKKNKKAYSYNYADLGSIIEGSREILSDNGLHVKQVMDFEITEAGHTVTILITELMHESGEWFRSYYPIVGVELKGQNYHQQMGSAITYARRYSLAAILNIAQVDDDAQSAGNPKTQSNVKNVSETNGVKKYNSTNKNYNEVPHNKASEKQINYLKKLIKESEHNYSFEDYLKSKGFRKEEDLTSDVVSRSIEVLAKKQK